MRVVSLCDSGMSYDIVTYHHVVSPHIAMWCHHISPCGVTTYHHLTGHLRHHISPCGAMTYVIALYTIKVICSAITCTYHMVICDMWYVPCDMWYVISYAVLSNAHMRPWPWVLQCVAGAIKCTYVLSHGDTECYAVLSHAHITMW